MMHEEDKDLKGDTSVAGRPRQIPTKPGQDVIKPTSAADAVPWRDDVHNPEICAIHRLSYDDWPLPKGKLDAGENLIATAAREIWEETGYRVRLGKPVGNISYPVTGRTKLARYWIAEVPDGELKQNSEVNGLRWVFWDEAEKLLSYDLDRDVLVKARKRMSKEPDTRFILVRHGCACHRANWNGNDALRPLDEKGRRQAKLLVPVLEGFRPGRVYFTEPVCCRDIVAPLAAELGMQVTVDERPGDERWIANQAKFKRAFEDIVALGGVSVICFQGITIPDLLAAWSVENILPFGGETLCKKGSAWVLDFNDGVMITADYYAPALPVR